GRAERPHRARGGAPGVRARGRQGRSRGGERGAARTRVRPAELSGLLRAPAQPVVLALLAGACIFLLVGSLESSQFAELTVSGVAQGSVFASLALALVLIYRATDVINFAQGEMATATTYFAYQLTVWGVSYWAAFFATLGLAFVLGVGIQQTVIR